MADPKGQPEKSRVGEVLVTRTYSHDEQADRLVRLDVAAVESLAARSDLAGALNLSLDQVDELLDAPLVVVPEVEGVPRLPWSGAWMPILVAVAAALIGAGAVFVALVALTWSAWVAAGVGVAALALLSASAAATGTAGVRIYRWARATARWRTVRQQAAAQRNHPALGPGRRAIAAARTRVARADLPAPVKADLVAALRDVERSLPALESTSGAEARVAVEAIVQAVEEIGVEAPEAPSFTEAHDRLRSTALRAGSALRETR